MSVVAKKAPSGAVVPAQLMSLALASSEAAQQEQELTVVAYRKNLEKVQEAFQAVLGDLESFKKSVMEEISLLRQERVADRALIEALRKEVRALKKTLGKVEEEFHDHTHWMPWSLESQGFDCDTYCRTRVGLPKSRPASGKVEERYVRRFEHLSYSIRLMRGPYLDPPPPSFDQWS